VSGSGNSGVGYGIHGFRIFITLVRKVDVVGSDGKLKLTNA